jgi:anti-anti-sigma factor
MTFETADHAGIQIVHLHGELTGDDMGAFVEQVTNLLSGAQRRIVLELSDVPFMNSTALGQLVRVVAQANVQEARVVLARPSAFVEGVLSTTRLDRFFEVFPSAGEALRRIK